MQMLGSKSDSGSDNYSRPSNQNQSNQQQSKPESEDDDSDIPF